jgi:hypothetical protein
VPFSTTRPEILESAWLGGRWVAGNDRQLRALLLSRFVGQKLTTFIATQNYKDLIVLTELIRSWEAYIGHRPHLPAERRTQGHPVPGAGARCTGCRCAAGCGSGFRPGRVSALRWPAVPD